MVLKDRKIFLVEDNVTNLAVIRTALRIQGASVPYDHWGAHTIKRLMNSYENIDLIILDLMLPGLMSGYDVFDKIKAVPELKNIPVIALTASDSYVEVPRTKAKGFNGYISKPIKRNTFAKDLLKVIEGGEVWPE
ncbi:MAG: response regulator [Chloroflexota bacterium]